MKTRRKKDDTDRDRTTVRAKNKKGGQDSNLTPFDWVSIILDQKFRLNKISGKVFRFLLERRIFYWSTLK